MTPFAHAESAQSRRRDRRTGVLEWADRDHPIGGLIAAAAEGDQNAAERARAMVRALIETYR